MNDEKRVLFSNIIPSVKLKVLSVHKIYSMSCLRKYFWRWIMNLEPKKINFNFWYGGVLHTGFEALVQKGLKTAYREMNKESRRRAGRHLLTNEDRDEISLQLRLLKAIIGAASKQKFIKDIKMRWTEKQIKCKIPNSKVLFCCTMDGAGSYKGQRCSFEIKTASRVNNDFFTALAFNKQIHSQAWAAKRAGEEAFVRCAYCVFRKPMKRIKRLQSADEFIKEMQQDLVERSSFYFGGDEGRPTFPYVQNLGKNTLRNTGLDVTRCAELLSNMYNVEESRLLDPNYWPCNSQDCLSFGACPYLLLCRNLPRWKLYERVYQQRQMLYDEEQEELKY